MIGRFIPPVAAHERAQRHILCRLDLVRCQETEAVLVPFFRCAKVSDFKDRVADPADMGGGGVKPDRRAQPWLGKCTVTQGVSRRRGGCCFCLSRDNFDAVAIRIR